MVRPDAMSRTSKDHRPVAPRTLLAFLFLLVFLGSAGTAAAVVAARTTQTATKEDVRRAAQVLEVLSRLEAAQRDADHEHARRSAAEHEALCLALESLGEVFPCPPPLPAPTPIPSPAPTP